ncbi:MAG: reverse transcriptase family protein [Candidatus Thiodiazotropha endolucinida]|nr:reverse transcriptase family protein [Candidatus Thiodiazotropha taylori]MCW4345990.1 reverse transcriptase family protein [Candidatus Thiodiazotropha endolucinida]
MMYFVFWTDNYSNLTVSGFQVFALHRRERKKNSKRNSGGVLVYIRDKYVTKDTLVYSSDDDILWVKISNSVLSLQDDLYICLCYVTPDDSSRQSMVESNIFDRLLDSVLHVENKSQNKCNILICGDFNSRTSTNDDFVFDDDSNHMSVLPDEYISDKYMPRYSQDQGHVNNNGLLLLEFCKQTGVRIMNGRAGNDRGVGRYTFIGHRGCSLVDYVLASQELFNFVSEFEVQGPNVLSDHCLINFSLELKQQECAHANKGEQVSGRYVWDNEFKNEYIDQLQTTEVTDKLNLLNTKISNSETCTDTNSCVSDFVRIIEDVSSPIFKKAKRSEDESTASIRLNPWYNDECHERKFYFLQMLDKYRACNSDENRLNMVKARSNYKKTIRQCRYNYDKEKTKKFCDSKYKNAKMYWNMLKELSYVKPANIALSTFEVYFKSVNNPSDPFFSPDEDILEFNERYVQGEINIIFDELNLKFSENEIIKAIQQLKTGRSGGPDRLINEFFIHGKHVLVPTICNLFNKIFENGYFPEQWAEGYIVPLHKKGNTNDVENYRGITLLSTLGKLFSRVINNRLCTWAENYDVLIEAQAGFRPGMSTVDNIFVLHGVISHMLNQGKKLYCSFVDFTKAFDYVVRDNLWFKLIKLGLRGHILNIIKSMYNSVKSRVKFCNQLGEEFCCTLGVRQGECLSPLLFSLFLNDIEELFLRSGLEGIDINMIQVFMLLYADDIVIFANSAEDLQLSLDLLAEYCIRWKLKINVAKTKVIVFRKGGMLPRDIAFYYQGERLEIVNSFKYLGVVFTTGGSFSEAQNTLAGQAQKAIFKLNKYLYKFTFISPKHKLELFDKLITPILNYASEVWGFKQANRIERVHLQYCKKLLGVKKTTQNDFVYGEFGRTDFRSRRYLLIIKYWFKILYSREIKYIKLMYELMLNDIERHPTVVNWASLVRDILLPLGFNEVWLQQGVGDFSRFLSLFKQRLKDTFIQSWHSRINDSSRALFYRSIATFQFQPYLEKINISKFSTALSRLRVSSHRLSVESGRWVRPNSIPLSERKCILCNTLEDEYHFVLECPAYDDLRKVYIPKYYRNNPSMFKFIDLINSTSEGRIRKLSVYIFYAFKLRAEMLYGD